MSNRKRRASEDDSAPPTKKPKLDQLYTRTDPVTGELGRIRKKDAYYKDQMTRRAKIMRLKREEERLQRLEEDAHKKKERQERRKAREELKKKQAAGTHLDIDTESETDSDADDDEEDSKRGGGGEVEQTPRASYYHLTKRFEDHVCVVTGGGRGIGQACAIRLAQEGGIVYVLDNKRWKDTVDDVEQIQKAAHEKKYESAMATYHADMHRYNKAQKSATNKNTSAAAAAAAAKHVVKPKKPRKVRFRTRCFQKKCDVTDVKQVRDTIAAIVKERGYIDVVLNCVNTTGKDYGDTPSHSVTHDQVDRVMKLNLTSTFLLCQAVLPQMLKEQYGRIVNLAAFDGKSGAPKCMAFAAAKAAVINLTKTLGQEYAGTGITVNCIAPQYDDYHVNKLGQGYSERAVKVPMGRAVDMDELAGSVAFIASEENSYTTGFCYDLSGGNATY